MLVWNSSNTFGVPADGTPYLVGQTIPGGGTVLQNNTNTAFSHTPLSPNTPYYYKAFSVDGSVAYSSGVTASATTSCEVAAQVNENFELTLFPPAC
ncbi:MAG: hypothetical protein KBC43_06015 [Bacteroidales bacterium]|nr:hypothetical protein [Bacteroidales bacterium]